jgi:N-acetyl-alpha-D-muramate 1-phosphate uridylyltransferase
MSVDKPECAMIFAAGFGTRMGAMTATTPKPMIQLNGRPMVDHSIALLRNAGIDRIVANTHYLSDRIAPHLKDAGVTVLFEQPCILETGGGLKAARRALGASPVVTLNPDTAWIGPNPVSELLDAWRANMTALLLLVPLSHADTERNTGDFSLEQGEIRRSGDYLYTGAQIIRTDRLDEIDASVFSLNTYWDHLSATGPLNGTLYSGRWCDIGTPDGLARAEKRIRDV